MLLREALAGQGVPLAAFFGLLTGLIYNEAFFDYPVIVFMVLCWIAPLKAVGKIFSILGQLRGQMLPLMPYMLDWDLLKLGPTVKPHMQHIIDKGYVEKLGELVPLFVDSKEYVIPYFPELLENIDTVMPVLKVLKPHFKKVAPYVDKLLPHMDVLSRNIQAMAPYLDDFLPFMEEEGWEALLVYLDDIAPWIVFFNVQIMLILLSQDALIPHVPQIKQHFKEFVPIIPLLAKYMDNFGPILDELLPLTNRLVPFIPLMSAAELTGIFSSKIIVQQLPKYARLLPGKTDPPRFKPAQLDPQMVYSIPPIEELRFSVPCMEKRMVKGIKGSATVVWFYKISVGPNRSRFYRYKVLRCFHDRMRKKIILAAKDVGSSDLLSLREKLPKFPSKSTFGKTLSTEGAMKRATEIDHYFNEIIAIANGSIYHIPDFKYFLCSICILELIDR